MHQKSMSRLWNISKTITFQTIFKGRHFENMQNKILLFLYIEKISQKICILNLDCI